MRVLCGHENRAGTISIPASGQRPAIKLTFHMIKRNKTHSGSNFILVYLLAWKCASFEKFSMRKEFFHSSAKLIWNKGANTTALRLINSYRPENFHVNRRQYTRPGMYYATLSWALIERALSPHKYNCSESSEAYLISLFSNKLIYCLWSVIAYSGNRVVWWS